MDPSAPGAALTALGEDLFLLSIRARDRKLMTRRRIDPALMGAELVRLAAAGRASIAAGRIVVRDRAATAMRNWTTRWRASSVPRSRRGRKRGSASPGRGSGTPMPAG